MPNKVYVLNIIGADDNEVTSVFSTREKHIHTLLIIVARV